MKGYFGMKRFFALSLAMLIMLSLFACGKKSSNNIKIATSFYPVYVTALNLTEGAENIELINLTDSNYGCIHNYMISADDIKKLDGTRLFIASGLEMENFVAKTSLGIPKLEMLESGEDIPNIITENERDNPHYWMNIENAISHCDKVGRALEKADPANAEIYKKNTEEYTAKLLTLLEETRSRMELLDKKEMVALDDSFEYFADEFGLKLTKLLPRHGEKISEQEIVAAVEYIKSHKVETVYVSMGDEKSDAVSTIAKETGCRVVALNTLTRGEINGDTKDAYFNAIRENVDILEENMG